jgi:hypothetical protein
MPHRHVRGGLIALLIGANLVQYALRVSVESGVPVDQIARDVAAANNSDGKVATLVAVEDDPANTSLGGNGGIFDFPGRYYLSIETGLQLRPKQLRDGKFAEHFVLLTDPAQVPPAATRLIVWTDVDKREEAILASIKSDWKLVEEEQHRVRDAWCWRSMFRCRRSVFLRNN